MFSCQSKRHGVQDIGHMERGKYRHLFQDPGAQLVTGWPAEHPNQDALLVMLSTNSSGESSPIRSFLWLLAFQNALINTTIGKGGHVVANKQAFQLLSSGGSSLDNSCSLIIPVMRCLY